jgi:hypothetical protein
MGLFDWSGIFAPSPIVHLSRNYRLFCTNMKVANGLFARLVQLRQRFECCP